MKIELPSFNTKSERNDYLLEHADDLCYQKKNEFKEAPSIEAPVIRVRSISQDKSTNSEKDVLTVKAVINTTMIMDSHDDVHINDLFSKSINENKRIKHIQEHKSGFEYIISDKEDLNVYTKIFKWRDLGYDVDGETQALIFESKVRKERNEFMYNQYMKNRVDNHSVGMYYVIIKMAINDERESYKENKAEFDKWIDKIANKDEVLKQGFFFAIYEAKIKEGSAVPDGSNPITPTLSRNKHSEEVVNTVKAATALLKESLINLKQIN